ncbi:Dihydrodipicolinate synthase [Vulcanisaeta moutnovskia 768-28]|uniref:Dihydrodipicolinate synthase n=1 Tax=Vulcanisaeta moutnovskia (strain 768-28) TaxID=985053 RepID=F0QWW2_VULM7|nr:dihydrodipicolinate synthase family protein [Vulcanisaeta moutnovskia]ADY01080.1 Dihydrodipicolinate synthase [Vulcanisaeta moutnovskia 768-28]
MEFRGAVAEVFIPLNASGDIDEGRVGAMLDFLLRRGVEGFYVGGFGAEAFAFTTEERLGFLRMVVGYVRDRVPVSFLVSEMSIKRAVEVIREVGKIGIDVLTIPQPYPQQFGERGILDYVCALSREFGGDVMLYNEPAVGNPLNSSMVIKILDKCPNIEYLKDSSHDMIGLHTILSAHPELRVMAGSDGLIYDIMLAGGVGVVSLVINPFPELIVRIVNELRSGNYVEARRLQEFIVRVRSVLKAGGLSGGYRYAMSLVGIDIGKTRPPYEDPDEKTKDFIRNSLISLGLIKQ